MKKESIDKLSYQFITKTLNQKNYIINQKPNILTIVGIRSEIPVINKFEDYLCVLYIDDTYKQNILITKCTTIPGIWGLDINLAKQNNIEKDLNINGTAIVKESYYKNLWKIGLHKKREALIQCGPITVYRQKLLDGQLHIDESTPIDISSDLGIDCHDCRKDKIVLNVNNWSLGCIVINDPAKFIELLKLCHIQVEKTDKKLFDFYLINEKDFEKIIV